MEHVAAPERSPMRPVQNFVNYFWPYFTDGCQLTRETWKVIEHAGFTSTELSHFELKTRFMKVVKYALYGHAIK